jgi:hypothetical protein
MSTRDNTKVAALVMLLLASAFGLVLDTRLVRADYVGSIVINADGSINPVTAPIQRNGESYTITDNIYGSIVVQRDNVFVDGAGFIVFGAYLGIDFVCIDLRSRTNVTIMNMQVNGGGYGPVYTFLLDNSSGNTIRNNVISAHGHEDSGVSISGSNSSYNIISENSISEGQCGVSLSGSENFIEGNHIYNIYGGDPAGVGISLTGDNNTVQGNTIAYILPYGLSLTGSGNRIIHNNFMSAPASASGQNVWDNGYPDGETTGATTLA